ncbi:MAG: hypothetical protein AB7E85_00950 [Pseudobdellovibrionaceae bacterium]
MSDAKTQSLKVFFGPQQAPLSTWWWLVLPVVIFIVQLVLEVTLSKEAINNMVSENGFHEIFQAIVSFLAAFTAGLLLLRRDVRKDKMLFVWIGIAFLGSVYITGEEISWGQWFFNWATPEGWAQYNDQGETNLHNTSSWLDQKPRLLLEIGVIVGGILIPLSRYFKLNILPARFDIFYPLNCMLPIAFIGEAGKILDVVSEAMDHKVFVRYSEIHELYLFGFVLLYLIVLKRRLTSGF